MELLLKLTFYTFMWILLYFNAGFSGEMMKKMDELLKETKSRKEQASCSLLVGALFSVVYFGASLSAVVGYTLYILITNLK